MLLGHFFLAIGLIAVICNRKAKPYPFILLVFPLAGIIMIAGTHRRTHVTMPVYSISYNGEEKLLRIVRIVLFK